MPVALGAPGAAPATGPQAPPRNDSERVGIALQAPSPWSSAGAEVAELQLALNRERRERKRILSHYNFHPDIK